MKAPLFLLIICTLLVSSCRPFYYVPSTHNVPLITSKGESELSFSSNLRQWDLQASYGITRNLALMTSYSYFELGDVSLTVGDLNLTQNGTQSYRDLGLGYYKSLPHNFVFETYGIFGFANIANERVSTSTDINLRNGNISANFYKIGLQPNIGYKAESIEFTFSSPIFHLKHFNIDGDLTSFSVDEVQYLQSNSSNYLIEPSLTIKAGFKNLKFRLQYVGSYNLFNPQFTQKTATC